MRSSRTATALLAFATATCLAAGSAQPILGAVTPPREELSANEMAQAAYDHYRSGELTAALDLLEEASLRHPEDRITFLNIKYMVLAKTDDTAALVEVALERAQYFQDSPKKSREVLLAYLRAGNEGQAVAWLEITLDRGFLDHADLRFNPAYDPIRDTEAFRRALETVADRIGIGREAKPFAGRTLEGSRLELKEYRGKVVLIDFWAVYCLPCLAEIESMLGYYPAFKDRGFEIIGVNLDEDEDSVQRYVREKAIPWPVIHSGDAWEDPIRTAYALANIPSYWLIDREGIVRRVSGDGEGLEGAIRELLERPAG